MSNEDPDALWRFCTTITDMDSYAPGHSSTPMPDELLIVEQHRMSGEYRCRPLTDVIDPF